MSKKRKITKSKSSKLSRKTESRVLCHSRNIIAKNHDNGTIAIMHFDNDDAFFILKTYAREFWTLIDGKRTVEEIEQILIDKHDLPVTKFKNDIKTLLKDLTKANLIEDATTSNGVII